MRLLLDTHAFLWFVLDDPQLSSAARGLMVDPNNELLFSPVSSWEIAIKVSTGKYSVAGNVGDFVENWIAKKNLALLPISVRHTAAVATLPFHHRDPFDRLLIAQAMTESVPVLSADPVFDAYPVTRMW